MNKKTKPMILGIIGSPRKNGNTEIMIDEVLAGAKDAGAVIDKISLYDLDISPCIGCNSCKDNGTCSIKDDMSIVYDKMRESDVFIMGTPIYYWGPTGQFKSFFDRLLAATRQGIIKGKKVILTIPLGGSEPVARHTVGMLTDALNYMSAEIVAKIVSPSTLSTGEVKQKTDKMKSARESGKEVIKNL
ncbi:MAG: flavodoxin family protein [Asgard group archaeon]|nr:flavodoxin family protein [Asgard group archaeon]